MSSRSAQDDVPGRPKRRWRVLRAVRVASTSMFALSCVAFIVLWARSYATADSGMCCVWPGQHVAFHGGCGRMCVWFEHSPGSVWWNWNSIPIRERTAPTDENRIPILHLQPFWPTMTRLYIAHWVIVVATAGLALAPWAPKQWSLRALLLATSLCAAVTGLITWIDRTF